MVARAQAKRKGQRERQKQEGKEQRQIGKELAALGSRGSKRRGRSEASGRFRKVSRAGAGVSAPESAGLLHQASGAKMNGDLAGVPPGDTAFDFFEVPSGVGIAESEVYAVPPPELPGELGAGHHWPRTPRNYVDWLDCLSHCKNLKQAGIFMAWGCQAGFLLCQSARAGPSRSSNRPARSGGLFPLPVCWPADFQGAWQERLSRSSLDFSKQCWVALSCTALNALYGSASDGLGRTPGKVHAAVLEGMRERVGRFLEGEADVPLSFNDVVKELRERKLSYTGEEITQPRELSPEQIVGSLPPPGHGGSIPLTFFLTGRTKYLVENPLENLIPLRERSTGSTQAKVHIQKGFELEVFKLLETRGIIKWVPADTTFKDAGGSCLNGLFGVEKPGKTTPSGKPVLRVIMNLVPANRLLQVIAGDIQLLPSAAAWLPLVLDRDGELHISQGDMSAAFYLFAIPPQWDQFMTFNCRFLGEQVGMTSGSWFRPCCRVLPMGWNSSVGIMQMLTREILLRQGLPRDLELHKGKSVPRWFMQLAQEVTPTTAFWQVYLDNFMSAERSTTRYAAEDVSLQAAAMRAWHGAGVLTAEDKQVLGSREATELGIRFDGIRGLLGASSARVLKTSLASVRLLQLNGGSKREAQIILGRWIFILQFRRAGMSFLSRSWDMVASAWPPQRLRNTLVGEIQLLMCVAPLLQADLRADYDEQVTVSDASETGGAAAVSVGLTWSGRSFVHSVLDDRLRPLECPILVISAFNGIGGAFRIYDVLGIQVLGRISIEILKEANRTTRTAWPNTWEYHDITRITEDEVKHWANMFPRVLEVHIWGGFPCIHLSRVRAFRQNLEGEGSKLFWHLLTLITWIQGAFGEFAKVKFCIENVASMDESARQEISAHLEVQPVKLDPADSLPFSRPHLAWCSEALFAMEGLTLERERDYVRAYVTEGSVLDRQWLRTGWTWPAGEDGSVKLPTFMKAIPRSQPPPHPAGLSKASQGARIRWTMDQFRFPPYQYGDKFLFHHPSLGPRIADASEREILLGFGPGHTFSCRAASQVKGNLTAFEDMRRTLCGDSFAISSFAIMGAVLCADLMPRMRPGQIINRLGLAPGTSAHPLVSCPMTRWLAYGGDGDLATGPDQLARHLGGMVNHTGSDVREATGEPMNKRGSHGSVRAMWWQWKHLFKTRWVSPSHIYLEMKMILLSLLWKARDPSKIGKRWIHLEDSMVCLYILSKGRTSSHLLQPLCQKVGALQLGLGVTLLHGHVTSLENPTDAGSRA